MKSRGALLVTRTWKRNGLGIAGSRKLTRVHALSKSKRSVSALKAKKKNELNEGRSNRGRGKN